MRAAFFYSKSVQTIEIPKCVQQSNFCQYKFGDFNASYYMFPFECYQNIEVVIKGQYPHARYISFTVSGVGDILIASAHDQDLVPDPGSINPFESGGNWDTVKRNYTLIISPAPPPANKEHFVSGAGCNTIYTGSFPSGRLNEAAVITYRIYAPSIGYDQTSNGLPEISYRICNSGVKGTDIPVSNTTEQAPSQEITDCDHDQLHEVQQCKRCDINWSTPSRFQSVLLQFNPNTVYMISNELDRDPDKFLNLHWKAPKVPDTWHNVGIAGKEDMRYWSFAFFAIHGAFGLKTISDYQTVVDQDGYVNLIVGFGAPRPSFVTPDNGFTWVDLSELPPVPISIIYRNILISSSFKYSAKDVPVDTLVPPRLLGEYYPCGNYSSRFDLQS